MKLLVRYIGTEHGAALYVIMPRRRKRRARIRGDVYEEDRVRLRELAPQIERKAQHLLGERFNSLEEWSPGLLLMRVPIGTSRGKLARPFEKLKAWIEVFADEPP